MLAALRLIWHVLVAVFKLNVTARRWTPARRRAEIAAWSQAVFRLLNIRLVATGEPVAARGSLFAGNHVSWLDIYALLAIADMRFVAKSEVRDWPIVGRMATQLGTHFIVRNRNGEAHVAASAMGALLNAGENVGIFPEGSTTEGDVLRPFRPALFEPAAEGRSSVQPFAIRYLDGQGRRATAAAFIGEMSILDSLGMLFRCRDLTCELSFPPPIETAGKCRRTLARETEAAVMAALGVAVSSAQSPLTAPADAALVDLALA